MLLVQSEFKLDKVQAQHVRNVEELINAHVREAYVKLGELLAQTFPYKKIEEASFHGELPQVALTRDHQFTDLYKTEFFVVSRETLTEIAEVLNQEQCRMEPEAFEKLKQLINNKT